MFENGGDGVEEGARAEEKVIFVLDHGLQLTRSLHYSVSGSIKPIRIMVIWMTASSSCIPVSGSYGPSPVAVLARGTRVN